MALLKALKAVFTKGDEAAQASKSSDYFDATYARKDRAENVEALRRDDWNHLGLTDEQGTYMDSARLADDTTDARKGAGAGLLSGVSIGGAGPFTSTLFILLVGYFLYQTVQ